MELVEKLKCFLRTNPFYKKYCQTHVNDFRYGIRNRKYYSALYSWKKDKEVEGHTVYFIIDPQISHPGLADRFKAIVGTYYIAKQNGFDFKILFSHPFSLNDYLRPASRQWIATKEELSYSRRNSRIIAYNGGGKVPRLNKSVKQYHVYCYIGYDILETNRIGNYQQLWGKLFRELFRPAPVLEKALQEYSAILQENEFIAVHLRFVNALEPFEENQFNFLDQEQKEGLVQRCLEAIRTIQKQYTGKKVAVFSDSAVFLKRVREELPVTVLDGEIGHISFNAADHVVLKTFIDFYMMSRAQHVIYILSPEMYPTVFSYYAALAGGKTCRKYLV